MNKIFNLRLVISIVSLLFTSGYLNAQIKVGDNPTTINPNAVIEIESTNKGMLLPRIQLTGTAFASPLSSHVAGMAVYNTATSGDVTPGYYYNDGTKWNRIFGVSAANNTTAANVLIKITNGNGATLTAMTVGVDTTELKTFLNNKVQVTVNAPFTGNGTSASPLGLTTNNTTATNSIITITNGTGATLSAMTIGVDTTILKNFIINSINNGTISGNNLTAGSLLKTTGTPTGASLKLAGYEVDTNALKTFVTNNVNSGGITGKNTTAGSLVTVTNGTGASFTSMTVAVDTTAMKTFITNNAPGVTANNTSAGSLITITNGNGATLTNMTVAADTTALKTFIANNVNKAPIKDSIGNAVTNLFNSNAITGKNVTAGSLVTLTGTPTGASVKDFGVAVDTTSMKTFIAKNINKAPIKDSIGNTVNNLISTNSITGNDLTGNGVIVTNGVGTTLKATSLRVDSSAIAKMVTTTMVKDSVLKLIKDSFIQVMNPKTKWFYAPTISIPVTALGTGLTKDLYAAYVANFSTPAVKNSLAPATIPVYASSELNYYISEFDNSVLSNVSISNTGVMTYDIISTSPTDCSYVNVIFTIK